MDPSSDYFSYSYIELLAEFSFLSSLEFLDVSKITFIKIKFNFDFFYGPGTWSQVFS